MDRTQADAIRDTLIAEQAAGDSPLACKFEGWLVDHIEPSRIVNYQVIAPAPGSPEQIAAMTDECRAFILAAHARAMAALADELKGDPEQLGYATMKPEAIQAAMTAERITTERVAKPPSQLELIKQAVAFYLGKDYQPPPPEMIDAVKDIRPPRVSVFWNQIPYCRNVPTLDNIAAALAGADSAPAAPAAAIAPEPAP